MTSSTEQISRNRQGLSAEDKKLTLWRLIEPGLLHGIGLCIYLAGGYWVFTSFNESFLGFLGVVMLLWAALKALIVLAIYGFVIFALLFRQSWFANTVERRLMKRLKVRMDRDIETGKVNRAMDRAHGMLCRYPHHGALRRRLASLLIAEDRLADAGRHLIYLPDLMEIEKQAVAAFCKANGHDPFQILRKSLKGLRLAGLNPWEEHEQVLASLPKDHPLREEVESYDPENHYTYWVDEADTLPRSALAMMKELHGGIEHENEQNSRLYRNLPVYFSYKERSRVRAFLQTNRNSLIDIAIGLLVTGLMLAIHGM